MIGLSTALLVFSSIAAGAGALTWLSVLYYCSYIKLAVTLIKYIPQVCSALIDHLNDSFEVLDYFYIKVVLYNL